MAAQAEVVSSFFPPGHCLAASGTGTVTPASGDVIFFNTVGLLCEEAEPGSALQYNGTYRITGGQGRFASVVGGGNLEAALGIPRAARNHRPVSSPPESMDKACGVGYSRLPAGHWLNSRCSR